MDYSNKLDEKKRGRPSNARIHTFYEKFINHLMDFNKQHHIAKKKMIESGNNVDKIPFRYAMAPKLITEISNKFATIVSKEPNLLRLSAPFYIFGDIHGQFSDMVRFLEMTGLPPNSRLLFMGDYVDRGDNSIEVVMMLFALKIRYPKNVYILRGNHECSSVNDHYGFKDECIQRYGAKDGLNIWNVINKALHQLSMCALIDNSIFCTHGGITEGIKTLDDINKFKKGNLIPDSGAFCDLVWSDPKKSTINWMRNDRGVSYTFNENALNKFMEKHDLSLVCRAHQVVKTGFKFFGKDKKLVTIFSAPNYCGDYGNKGAVMLVDKDLKCSFSILKPVPKRVKKYRTLSISSQGDE